MNEENKVQTTAKDFFLHLGVIATLYASVIALLNLLFSVINTAFPQIDRYYGVPNMSLPMASLIVAFPIFLVLTKLVYKSFEKDQGKRNIWVRKWLMVLTLFVAGAVLAGDLVTLVYYFLDGQELTTGFILKVLSVLVVSFAVFGYFLQDMKDKLTVKSRRIWLTSATVIVLVVIILGFSVIGSPRTQRLIRYDEQKVNDLQNIQSQIIYHWQSKEALPNELGELDDPLASFIVPKDSQTGDSYVYKKTNSRTFELCADFNLKGPRSQNSPRISNVYKYGTENEVWNHEAGEYCFERIVDPDRYPQFRTTSF